MEYYKLFEDKESKIFLLKPLIEDIGSLIGINILLIIEGKEAYIIDPGGVKTYNQVKDYIDKILEIENAYLNAVILTHQDPDVSSSINFFLEEYDIEVYFPRIWLRFLSHLGIEKFENLNPIPDNGSSIITMTGNILKTLPAHFLHSPGNIHIYHEKSKILFSGDLGASETKNLFINKIEEVASSLKAFHERYIASNKALDYYINNIISNYEIELLVPQHGGIYKNNKIKELFRFLVNLECGVDIIEKIYTTGKSNIKFSDNVFEKILQLKELHNIYIEKLKKREMTDLIIHYKDCTFGKIFYKYLYPLLKKDICLLSENTCLLIDEIEILHKEFHLYLNRALSDNIITENELKHLTYLSNELNNRLDEFLNIIV
jgi:flavorubredoxin